MLDALVREQIVYKAVWPGKEPKKKSQSQQVLLINPSYRSAHLPALFWNYEAQTSFWGLKKQPDKVSTPAVAQATSNKTLAEVDRLELNPNEKPPASSARKQDGSVLPSASTSQTTIQPHLHPTGTEGVLANEQTGSNISDVPVSPYASSSSFVLTVCLEGFGSSSSPGSACWLAANIPF